MPVTTKDGLFAAFPGRSLPIYKVAPSSADGDHWVSLWKQSGIPAAGATPPTGAGEIPTSATTGAIQFPNGDDLRVGRAELSRGGNSTDDRRFFMVADRLLHTSGLVANTTSTQTITSGDVPTGRAPGYAPFLGIEVYAQPGSTSSIPTISYTNQDGTSGRSSVAPGPMTNTTYVVESLILQGLQAGDKGVKSVESLTLSASTGAAGNLGITLFRPVMMLVVGGAGDKVVSWPHGLPPVPDDACLFLLTKETGLNAVYSGGLNLVEVA